MIIGSIPETSDEEIDRLIPHLVLGVVLVGVVIPVANIALDAERLKFRFQRIAKLGVVDPLADSRI